MRRAARVGRGTYTFIGQRDEVQSRMAELLQRIDIRKAAPVLDPTVDELVLVTCYPFHQWTAGGSGRYLVIARPDPDRHQRYESPDIAGTGPARAGGVSRISSI